MKIDNISHLPGSARVDQGKGGGKVSGAGAASASGSASVAQLSVPGGDSGQDIDQARVAELRQAIAEGRLQMDPDRVADRLIASVRDMLGAVK